MLVNGSFGDDDGRGVDFCGGVGGGFWWLLAMAMFFFSRCMMVQGFVVGFCGSSRCVLGEGASES